VIRIILDTLISSDLTYLFIYLLTYLITDTKKGRSGKENKRRGRNKPSRRKKMFKRTGNEEGT